MNVIALNLTDFVPAQLPPIGCASVGVGIGKTETAIKIISRFAPGSKDFNQSDVSIMVVYAVPTHKLGDDLVVRFASAGVTSGVWRGRQAENSARPREKMCLKPEAVKEVSSLGLPIQQSMCRFKTDAGYVSCESFLSCPYQQQASLLRGKQVVIVPHDSLFYEMPNIGPRNMLIIDEAFCFVGLRGL